MRDLVPKEGRISEKDRKKIRKELQDIIDDFPETCAARDAQEVLEYI